MKIEGACNPVISECPFNDVLLTLIKSETEKYTKMQKENSHLYYIGSETNQKLGFRSEKIRSFILRFGFTSEKIR